MQLTTNFWPDFVLPLVKTHYYHEGKCSQEQQTKGSQSKEPVGKRPVGRYWGHLCETQRDNTNQLKSSHSWGENSTPATQTPRRVPRGQLPGDPGLLVSILPGQPC